MRKLNVIIKTPYEAVGHTAVIEDSTEALKEIVGGDIESVTVDDIVIITNDIAKILCMPYNCRLFGIDFSGTIVLLGFEEDRFADVPLTLNAFKMILRRDRI